MEKFIKQNYPNAVKGLDLTKECIGRLVEQHHFDLKKTLLATSVCSDEIIRSATNFREYLDRKNLFQLGGLAGYPFAGLTGLKAFADHIPDQGYAIIQYGSHIGVSKSGETGKMQRFGQTLESSCCGALQASLSFFENSDIHLADSELDYQLWKIEKDLLPKKDTILKHPVPLAAATDFMFDIIHEKIKVLVKAAADSFQGTKVAFIGGIVINTDHHLPDWFDLRNFEVMDDFA